MKSFLNDILTASHNDSSENDLSSENVENYFKKTDFKETKNELKSSISNLNGLFLSDVIYDKNLFKSYTILTK